MHDVNDILDEGEHLQAEAEVFLMDGDKVGGEEVGEVHGHAGNRGRKRTAAGRGRGRGRGQDRQSHTADTVLSMEDEQPIGVLRVYVGGGQLTAQCNRCGLRVNRQYTPHNERPGASPTGRPAGTLLAGLQQQCDGVQAHHRQRSFMTGTFEQRKACRHWQLELGLLQAAFDAGRPPRGAFEKKHLEPRDQC